MVARRAHLKPCMHHIFKLVAAKDKPWVAAMADPELTVGGGGMLPVGLGSMDLGPPRQTGGTGVHTRKRTFDKIYLEKVVLKAVYSRFKKTFLKCYNQ